VVLLSHFSGVTYLVHENHGHPGLFVWGIH